MEAGMTDESQTPQTDPVGRKGGGRKAGSTAPRANDGADILNIDQGLAEEDIPQDSAQAIAPVPFEFQGKAVRTIMKDGDIWFVAVDACAVLEHSNSRMAISGLDDDERGVSIVYTPGGPQRVNIVNESGLYNLVFTSRKPEAKAFRRWVTGVVLPTLRRTGQFEMNGEPGHARPVGDETSDGRATDRSRNGVAVSLPGPGRYLVVLFHDGDRRIEQLSFSDAVSALAALDCRSVAYSYLTVASLWEKLQHVRSVRGDAGGGFTSEKLSAAMQAGADLARQILYTYDEPILIPRATPGVAAE
jgi:prophage antirepressor-like protein